MKKILIALSFLFAFISFNQTAEAQWAVGGSYEIRNEDPENGFGFRIERSFLQGAPLIDLGIRAHFSYFNDENNV
ncbi:MAG: porin family protein, partial [Nitrosopumilaceae archaeon]|nr:porin family protein [Nitrosopumilaceae archaeon]NIU87583.1 porin family protein [Nitrosopumilaceae archaeon]NIV66161.1 porin family protein [Nitrosopumilaceae archaeon]NIX62029.1 porin family protein [Nitrosopumilaceae archaeon]